MDDRTREKLHAALERYRGGPPKHERSYPDLHEHVLALAREGLLEVIDQPINKDTEMHPLVRWQYRGGIPEAERKAFLFTQPTDSKGQRFDISVLVAGLAANPGRLSRRLRQAVGRYRHGVGERYRQSDPAPRGRGRALPGNRHHRRRSRQSTAWRSTACRCRSRHPGWDNAPYLSAGHYITKDPDSGVSRTSAITAASSRRRAGLA